uniref:CSD domain-containing protein n=1 Tax=Ditylum brightwellii TaxID=49249 RepID=A0A6U3S408_9STRA|mmetsp:Transcript_28919/g.43012  ORF Transcript_28919/g.43012 Transcript_28919/m.43012 type:complete len:130 (+) Transcript_28919:217-606(+)
MFKSPSFHRMIILAIIMSFAYVTAFVPSTIHSCRSKTVLFMSDENKRSGTVKWYNTQKGYGFIVPEDGTGDVFVHQSGIIADGFRSLADGEKVEFTTIVEDNGKTKAVDVTGPDGSDVQGAPFRPDFDE